MKRRWRTAVSWRLVAALAVSATAIGGGAAFGLGATDTVVVLSGMIAMVESVHRMLPRRSATDVDQESSVRGSAGAP
ncbi:hypothetical protein GCM10020369_35310 [Cryptosporangium minutisporangium]|uniref:DUF3040 domain-containing protein n=1 Tax=Cryptosporangium minutisporangium TaxID=113569 RepID=A0ABP6SZF6_9ACTN